MKKQEKASKPPETSATPSSKWVAAIAPIEGEIIPVPLNEIMPSPFQKRAEETDDELAGLTESIRMSGILEPLIVRKARPDAPSGIKYELVCGHRRLKSSRLAGLLMVPCVCRVMDDASARIANVLENLQRKELSPLDEADGVSELTDQQGMTAPKIAEILGVSERWVFRRRKLTAIIKEWRTIIREKKAGQLFCERLAAVPAPLQKLLLKTDLKEEPHAEKIGSCIWDVGARDIRNMPWHGKHAEWCASCPMVVNNLKNEQDGANIADDHALRDCKFCGDPKCLAAKSAAWVKEVSREVMDMQREAGNQVVSPIRVKKELSAPWPQSDKRTSKNTVPYICTDGNQAGKVIWCVPEKTAEELARENKPKPEIPGRQDELDRIHAIKAMIKRGDGSINTLTSKRTLELALLCFTTWEQGNLTRAGRVLEAVKLSLNELTANLIQHIRLQCMELYIDQHRYLTRKEQEEGYLEYANQMAVTFDLGERMIAKEISKQQEARNAN